MSTGVLRDWARGRHPLRRAFLSVLSGSVAVQEVLVGGLGRAKLRDLKMSATDLASGSVKGPVKKPPSRVRTRRCPAHSNPKLHTWKVHTVIYLPSLSVCHLLPRITGAPSVCQADRAL